MSLKQKLFGVGVLSLLALGGCKSYDSVYEPEIPLTMPETKLTGRVVWDENEDGIFEILPKTPITFYNYHDSTKTKDTTDINGFFSIDKGFYGRGLLFSMYVGGNPLAIYSLQRKILRGETDLGNLRLRKIVTFVLP
jgi:hypothetical protein